MPRRVVPQHPRVLLLAVLVLAVGPLAAGCLPVAEGTQQQLRKAVDQATSAVVTVQMSVAQYHEDKTFSSTAQTACSDMLTQVQSALKDAGRVSVSTPEQGRMRDRAARSIADAATVIVTVRDVLENHRDLRGAAVDAMLTAAREELASVSSSLGQEQ